jgi:arginase family enzyme
MIQEVLTPLTYEQTEQYSNEGKSRWGGNVTFYDGQNEYSGFDIAILGVKETRHSYDNDSCKYAPDAIRDELYKLMKNRRPLKIIDLGNIEPGATVKDTYVALQHVVKELMEMKTFPLILGGSHDLTIGQYMAYQDVGKPVHLVVADERIDLLHINDAATDDNFLAGIFRHQPNFLDNFSIIGYQSYFTTEDTIAALEKMHFDVYRLGILRDRMEEIEPVLRDADLFSFDVRSIKSTDAPGVVNPTPNGFYSEEACQVMRYAGLSDKLTSVGIYNYNPYYDERGQTAQLLAQMIWYFVDGFVHRPQDSPFYNQENFMKYIVQISDADVELVFLKSKISNRWWMQVRDPAAAQTQLIPCSYNDYLQASSDQLPDKWLKCMARKL